MRPAARPTGLTPTPTALPAAPSACTGGETTYYHYDGRGNTVAKQEPSGTTYYQYNTENLMTRIDFAAGGNSYYDYDADSKRVSQRTADGFRQFVYQGPDMLKLQLERDESEETVAHYTMGAGLEAMRRESSSFYHYNHLGTTLALTGADEAVSDTYRHDAWGVLLASTGSTINPHTYVGRERYYRMPNAAMYHLGFRDYAQGLGRFTTRDPAAGRIAVPVQALPMLVSGPRLTSPAELSEAYVGFGNRLPSAVDPLGLDWGMGDLLWDVTHLSEIFRQVPSSYWDYYVNEPLGYMADPCFDPADCLRDCLLSSEVLIPAAVLAAPAVLIPGLKWLHYGLGFYPIPHWKHVVVRVGSDLIQAADPFARPIPFKGVHSTSFYRGIMTILRWYPNSPPWLSDWANRMGSALSGGPTGSPGRPDPKWLIPLAGWVAGNLARCTARCVPIEDRIAGALPDWVL